MQYFKHSELVDRYRVSLKTVHNWIDSTKAGKIALKLYSVKNRTYIANTPENALILMQLSDRGKKYRNTLHHKIINPKPEFYQAYDRRQILDIITNLKLHGEIPREYNYFKDGATNWNNWLNKLAGEEEVSNILTGTIELISSNIPTLDRLLSDGKRVNVVDLGVGNAYPVKELLGHLIGHNLLHRYIAIDISPAMLEIAQQNIKTWYGNKVNFEGYVRDISYEHFDDLLVNDMLDKDGSQTINLVLLLGATPVNFKSFSDAFKPIHSSMGSNDLLMCTNKPDSEAARRYFDFNSPAANKLSPNHQYILDLMNIEESLYDVEMGFDTANWMRYIRVRLQAAVTIRFNFGDIEQYVDLEKGDTILLLRVWHMTTLEILSALEKNGFTLLQSSLTKDRQTFLSISAVETGEIHRRSS